MLMIEAITYLRIRFVQVVSISLFVECDENLLNLILVVTHAIDIAIMKLLDQDNYSVTLMSFMARSERAVCKSLIAGLPREPS
jgi:hypothetical protein